MESRNSKEILDSMRQLREDIAKIFEEESPERDTDMITLSESINEAMSEHRSGITGIDGFYLYRYSKADVYNLCNLLLCQVKLSPAGKLNDVYEGVPAGGEAELTSGESETFNSMAQMVCFSETPDDPLMWAHYADSAKGMCVEYDLSLLDDDSVLKYLFPVCYRDKRPFRTNLKTIAEEQKTYEDDCIQNNYSEISMEYLQSIDALYLVKGLAWAHEKEWRLLVAKCKMLNPDKPVFTDGIVPFNCATRIYLGPRMDRDIEKMINLIANVVNQKRTKKQPPLELIHVNFSKDEYNFTEEDK